MRYITLIGFICLWKSTNAQCASAAIKAYEAGHYAQAISLWNKELKTTNCNKENAYYLLGNAYVKNKNYAQGIASYEKSLRQNYNQEKVKFNIKVVRAKLGLDTENKILFTNDILRKVSFSISENVLKLMIVISSLFLLAYCVLRYFIGEFRYGFVRYYLFSIIFVLLALFFIQQYIKHQTGYGVISINCAGYENVNLQGESKTLREGEMVRIIDRIGETIQVETEANKNFWIQHSTIISI